MMQNLFYNFIQDETGATAIEYGLISALIAVAAIAAMTTLGKTLSNSFSKTATNLATAR